MKGTRCESIQELIPDYVAGRLATKEQELAREHFKQCYECEQDRDLAHLVFSSRAVEPEGLASKINAALTNQRVVVRRQWWGLTAAAVASLAIALNVSLDRSELGSVPLVEYEFEIQSENLWLTDDGLIAGAPMLEGLSDEVLGWLLEELIEIEDGGVS